MNAREELKEFMKTGNYLTILPYRKGNPKYDPEAGKPIIVKERPGRNDPCPCRSGRKFKHCHGK